jgi:phosphoglycolate phosphatase
MIKLVAFDWNGTILADMQCMLDADNYVLSKLGKSPINMAQLREAFDMPISKFFKNLGIAESEYKNNKHLFTEGWHGYYEPRVAGARTRAGTKEILQWLNKQQISTILFSNHIQDAIRVQLKRLKIDDLFKVVLANTDTSASYFEGKKKRLAEYIKQKGYKTEEVLVVGDTTEEIEIAKELGIVSVSVTGGNHSLKRLKAAKPDYLIHNLAELKDIIKK